MAHQLPRMPTLAYAALTVALTVGGAAKLAIADEPHGFLETVHRTSC